MKLSHKRLVQKREAVNRHSKTLKGFITRSYGTMKYNSRTRGMDGPSFSKAEYIYYLQNHPNFYSLLKQWESSKYDKWMRPSIDRINNDKGYSLDNIRLVTWKENYDARLPRYKFISRWKKSKFTEDDILKIRSRLSCGETCTSLAKEFGVRISTISAIKNRKNWSDI